MWFRRKKRPPLVLVPDLDELDRLRLEARDALKRSEYAAEQALKALNEGAPADGPEVRAARDAVHEANDALFAWIEAGGL